MTHQTGRPLQRHRSEQLLDNKFTGIATTLASKPHVNIFLEDLVVSV